jgi:hypothetical protein
MAENNVYHRDIIYVSAYNIVDSYEKQPAG